MPVDKVEAVADSNTLLQAARPAQSALLQGLQLASFYWHHAVEFRLHTHNQHGLYDMLTSHSWDGQACDRLITHM